jgi:hypothetical protein
MNCKQKLNKILYDLLSNLAFGSAFSTYKECVCNKAEFIAIKVNLKLWIFFSKFQQSKKSLLCNFPANYCKTNKLGQVSNVPVWAKKVLLLKNDKIRGHPDFSRTYL